MHRKWSFFPLRIEFKIVEVKNRSCSRKPRKFLLRIFKKLQISNANLMFSLLQTKNASFPKTIFPKKIKNKIKINFRKSEFQCIHDTRLLLASTKCTLFSHSAKAFKCSAFFAKNSAAPFLPLLPNCKPVPPLQVSMLFIQSYCLLNVCKAHFF